MPHTDPELVKQIAKEIAQQLLSISSQKPKKQREKKEMTEEQKTQMNERMAKLRAARKTKQSIQPNTTEQ